MTPLPPLGTCFCERLADRPPSLASLAALFSRWGFGSECRGVIPIQRWARCSVFRQLRVNIHRSCTAKRGDVTCEGRAIHRVSDVKAASVPSERSARKLNASFGVVAALQGRMFPGIFRGVRRKGGKNKNIKAPSPPRLALRMREILCQSESARPSASRSDRGRSMIATAGPSRLFLAPWTLLRFSANLSIAVCRVPIEKALSDVMARAYGRR
jgi:hypothetical protein